MTSHLSWLPEPLQYSDFGGDWDKFLSAIYGVFQRDFKQCRPSYGGRPVVHNTHIEHGKEKGFWHLIQRDAPDAYDRLPDLRRCERITWAKPIIENSSDQAISIWKKTVRRRRTRVLIWVEALNYLVVLEERSSAFFLVTAYCTDIESHRRRLRNERNNYLRQQKPP